ncbi:hypothetical protein BSZ35_14890 [Salinibacter sp. 10B]|uniref:hypothetical protein n=1 Tax=Salinibacter sp. 10B TaxID=1923971 RepID=UPI000CF4A93A|nr:hypothetical protein [Salinibacter sp. 10B]PQJ35708.1 hypothetical protein BSZ35_14890 [Salinibacter sp. 10B]
MKSVIPNPVWHRGTLEFAVTEATSVTVPLYNTLGRRGQMLYQGTPAPNTFTAVPMWTVDLANGGTLFGGGETTSSKRGASRS